MKKWIQTTEQNQWAEKGMPPKISESENTVTLTDVFDQKIGGFGGCFNELGYIALQKISQEKQKEIFSALFEKESGCNFNFCRLPIGANDYAAEWYSHNEHDSDYDMSRFSIERDYKYLLPYIKQAHKLNPEMKFSASPWSPPTWMKFPKAHNYGKLRMEPEILRAYALYFMRFIQAYESEGVSIEQITANLSS